MSLFRIFGKKADHAWKAWRAVGPLKELGRRLAEMKRIKSRKFWFVLVGGVLTGLNAAVGYPVPESTMKDILELLAYYVGAQAFADGVGPLVSKMIEKKRHAPEEKKP